MKKFTKWLILSALVFAITFTPSYIYGDNVRTFLQVAEWIGQGAPTVAPANNARIYYNSGTQKLMLSKNTGAYAEITTGGAITATLPLIVTGNDVEFGTAIAPTTADATVDALVGASTASQTPLAVQMKASNTANAFEIQTSNGTIQNAIAIGGATYSGSGNTNLGSGAGDTMTTATDNVNIGFNAGTAVTTSPRNTFIGNSAGLGVTTGSGDNVGVGLSALNTLSTGSSNTALGYNSDVSTTSTVGAIAIGKNSLAGAAQLVIGSASFPVADAYIGAGLVSATPGTVTYHGTGGSGNNVKGGALQFSGGAGTGSKSSDPFLFQLPESGAAAAVANTITTRMTINTDGTNDKDTTIIQLTANGASLKRASITESLTLTGVTTDTSGNLLPANSYILFVAVRVTTLVPNARTFSVGIAGNTTLYIAAGTSGSLNTTATSWANATPVAPANNSAAAKIRVTASNADAANGVIEIVTFYETATAPTQ